MNRRQFFELTAAGALAGEVLPNAQWQPYQPDGTTEVYEPVDLEVDWFRYVVPPGVDPATCKTEIRCRKPGEEWAIHWLPTKPFGEHGIEIDLHMLLANHVLRTGFSLGEDCP